MNFWKYYDLGICFHHFLSKMPTILLHNPQLTFKRKQPVLKTYQMNVNLNHNCRCYVDHNVDDFKTLVYFRKNARNTSSLRFSIS